MKLLLTALLFVSAFQSVALAQSPNPLLNSTQIAKDLIFPDKASRFPFSDSAEMALYKPDGAGPFPSLVFFPGCSGLNNNFDGKDWQNVAMLEWAKSAVSHGYVALLVDAMKPRGVNNTCAGNPPSLNNGRTVRDALQAAEHLRKFDFVAKDRIAFVGFSWGATKGLLVSSKRWANALAPGERFNAAVSIYPDCSQVRPNPGAPYDVITDDIDRPLLVLMGEKDTAAAPEICLPKLQEAKNVGLPVEWHVYAGTTHCWDCKNLNNRNYVDARGKQVVYRYDANVTKDSERRVFEFLDSVMPNKS